jgi:hypothetical protein
MVQCSTIHFATFQIFNLASKYSSNVFDNLEKNRLVPNQARYYGISRKVDF